MPYRFLEDAFTADIGFVASGVTLEECFTAAAEATLEVMLANVAALQPREVREVHLDAEALDLALLRFLEELVYRKDAEQVLLRPTSVRVTQRGDQWVVGAVLAGEGIDPTRHQICADVKAVTLHRLSVQWHDGLWNATVVLDILRSSANCRICFGLSSPRTTVCHCMTTARSLLRGRTCISFWAVSTFLPVCPSFRA